MTCIVGVRHKNGVLLAGDAQGSAGYDSKSRKDVKVFKLTREVACGFTTSYRMGQILRFHIDVGKVEGDEYKWAVTQFVPGIRTAFKEHGYTKVENGVETGGTFLLAVKDRLFQVESDFQVAEPIPPFDSCGCGDAYALGAMHALWTPKIPRRPRRAPCGVGCAAFSAGVGGPYTFVETRA